MKQSTPDLDARLQEACRQWSRRAFLHQCGLGIGAVAAADLLAASLSGADRAASPVAATSQHPLVVRPGHFPAAAKSVIYLFMAGGPSQLELFDDKPVLRQHHGQLPPAELVAGKRFAFLKEGAQLLGSQRSFARHGQCGMSLSELLPHHRRIVDDVCWLRGMTTDVFNHGPAKLFMNSGFQAPGQPSMGAWVTYGLGSESRELPGFVVLQSGPRGPRAGNALWSSGFLPTSYQGTPFRGSGEPILNLANPAGVSPQAQREFVDVVSELNLQRLEATGDAEISTRINALEMAYRMQASAPELMNIQDESLATLDMYGARPGASSFANNCLLARRLVERGVRFVQLYHTDWDHHGAIGQTLTEDLERVTREVDQSAAALVLDLKQRGLLSDTIVVWGGEFGRTPMGETRDQVLGGRDHHVDAFTMWVAGGGFRPGQLHGVTDDFGYNVVDQRVHVHDLHATLLNQLGLDHLRLTHRFQGRDYRLTDVRGEVVRDVIDGPA